MRVESVWNFRLDFWVFLFEYIPRSLTVRPWRMVVSKSGISEIPGVYFQLQAVSFREGTCYNSQAKLWLCCIAGKMLAFCAEKKQCLASIYLVEFCPQERWILKIYPKTPDPSYMEILDPLSDTPGASKPMVLTLPETNITIENQQFWSILMVFTMKHRNFHGYLSLP